MHDEGQAEYPGHVVGLGRMQGIKKKKRRALAARTHKTRVRRRVRPAVPAMPARPRLGPVARAKKSSGRLEAVVAHMTRPSGPLTMAVAAGETSRSLRVKASPPPAGAPCAPSSHLVVIEEEIRARFREPVRRGSVVPDFFVHPLRATRAGRQRPAAGCHIAATAGSRIHPPRFPSRARTSGSPVSPRHARCAAEVAQQGRRQRCRERGTGHLAHGLGASAHARLRAPAGRPVPRADHRSG